MAPGLDGAGLRPGWQTPDGAHMAALDLRLEPGWKTYWRAPGDAGVPPRFDFSGSRNLGAVRFHWPTPQVFDLNGMRSIGYKDALVLPLEITPRDPARPVHLSAKIEIGLCNHICMPVALTLSGDLDGKGTPDPAIRAALGATPRPAPGAARCDVSPIRDGLRLRAEITAPNLGGNEVTLVELPGADIWVSETRTRREKGHLVSEADLVPPEAQPFALDRSRVVLTVLGRTGAVEIAGCKG
ncbi:protein-disulfide reductase DsbD domain-containing protein [Phaeovulum vinaykumarii]|uniref:protein-disulfide reductase DsbD domain-containing protein n=1 Tax=Phaeovulum vinaykumarii TaxID=407234 RepID=UPI0038B25126